MFCWLGWKQPISVRPPACASAPWPNARPRPRAGGEVAQPGRPGEGAEADDDAEPLEQRELGAQPGGAGVALLRQRLVGRRRAAHGGGDEAVAQHQAVAAPARDRPVRVAGAMERREQEIAGAVPGEHAARAVGAVRGRRQAEQQHARRGVAEAAHRAAPVGLVAEGRALLRRDLLAPGDEPRAAAARVDLVGERGQRRPPGRRDAHHATSPRCSCELARKSAPADFPPCLLGPRCSRANSQGNRRQPISRSRRRRGQHHPDHEPLDDGLEVPDVVGLARADLA